MNIKNKISEQEYKNTFYENKEKQLTEKLKIPDMSFKNFKVYIKNLLSSKKNITKYIKENKLKSSIKVISGLLSLLLLIKVIIYQNKRYRLKKLKEEFNKTAKKLNGVKKNYI